MARLRRAAPIAAVIIALAGTGCDLSVGGGTLTDDSMPPAPPPTPTPTPTPTPAPEPAGAVDASVPAEFPCEVRAMMETYCAPCHANNAYVTPFMTREELLRPVGDGGSFGQYAAMMVMTAKMPPSSARAFPTADERVILLDWVAAGMPPGPCGPLTPP